MRVRGRDFVVCLVGLLLAAFPVIADAKPGKLGVDVGSLGKDNKARFGDLVNSLASPCGRAHSLRTSRTTDKKCKRAPFAVEYVFELLRDGANDLEIKELYVLRFKKVKPAKLSFNAKMPRSGPGKAKVKIAEFFDYGCPSCKMMQSVLDETMKGYGKKVALYYRQFPLDSHGPESVAAAQAAIAAHKQGKFKAMHALLFSDQRDHTSETLTRYATEIGLDMAAYQKDFATAKPLVLFDKAEGDKAGVKGTPTLFINGIEYEGPSHPKYLKMWIDESIAGTR